MTDEPRWLPRPAIFAVRDRLLAEHRGAPGAHDESRLAAALARPHELHADGGHDVFRLAAAHAFGIARDRPLSGADAAVALVLAGVFLELNGWRLVAPEREAANTTAALARGELDEGGYADWLREACEKAVRGEA